MKYNEFKKAINYYCEWYYKHRKAVEMCKNKSVLVSRMKWIEKSKNVENL